jgi:YHS domain-containing protein
LINLKVYTPKKIPRGGYMAIDPVCGMKVDEKKAVHKSQYKGVTYYFCSNTCKVNFEKEPEKYLKQKK